MIYHLLIPGPLWHELRLTGPDPKLTQHLSPDLRRVIQLMMTINHERRPTVKQLLELSPVQNAKRNRTRELAFNSCFQTVKSAFWTILWPLLLLLWTMVDYLAKPYETAKQKVRLWKILDQ
jgi:hypothetical protein